ncbi:MAG: nucleoside/nucleotide kinase family protein [Lachnospiraceae bacterium]|nr:nucleoside/nucleotide kinase family protein [Lachnospiraceae bacterium]
MQFSRVINGIAVCATYSDEEINSVFIPLLKNLADIQVQKKKRIIAMLAAPPGAGKSTLASFLEHISPDVISDHKVQAVGMDGFHRRQEYLLSHTVMVDGNDICMVDIKGAPVTFDLDALKHKIREAITEEKCGWPAYDRLLHNPVDDAVTIDGDIIILEGNYLLLDEEGWNGLSDMADYTISVTADPKMLKERLLARKISSGATAEEAGKFVSFSDMANVKLCLERTKPADLQLQVSKESGFTVVHDR